MNDKMPAPDKDEARRITAIDLALRMGDSININPDVLVYNAKIIETYLRNG